MVLRTWIRWVLIALFALLAVGVARAEYVDLRKDGTLVQKGECTVDDTLYNCFLVTLDEVFYLSIHDGKGEWLLYRFNEKKEPTQIWIRGQREI